MPNGKVMRQEVTLFRKAGKVLPEGLLEAVLKDHPSAGGYAFQFVKDNKVLLVSDTCVPAPTIEDVNSLLEEFKDRNLMMSFHKFPEGFDPSDAQPFVIQHGGEDVIAFAVEGDFPDFTDPKELSDAHNLTNEVILPTLQEVLTASLVSDKISWNKFQEVVKGRMFQRSMLSACGHRGSFAFLPLIGDAVMVEKNELGGSGEWGWTSNLCGWTEKQVEEPAEEEEKPATGFMAGVKNRFGKSKSTTREKYEPKAAEAVSDKPATQTTAAHNKTTPETPKTETAVEMVTIERGNMTEKQWRDTIRKTSGTNDLPAGWKKVKSYAFPRRNNGTEPIKSLQDIPKEQVKTVEQPKPNEEQRKAAATSIGNMTMSATGKSAYQDFALKVLDYKSGEIMPPSEMQALEAKYPRLSQQIGITVQDMYFWPTDKLFEIARKDPQGMVLAFLEMRAHAMSFDPVKVEDLTKYGTKTEETKTPEPEAHSSGGKGRFGKKAA